MPEYQYFKKLDLKLNLKLTDLLGPQINAFGPQFVEYDIKDRAFLNNELDKVLSFDIPPDRLNVTRISRAGTVAHKDAWPVALNYYLTPNNKDTTMIWNSRNHSTKDRGNHPTFFDWDDLDPIGSFVAEQNDLYLLNTKAIHSVTMDGNTAPRYILRFVWKYMSFKQVMNSIQIK